MPGYLLESMFVKGYKSFGEIELCLAPINVLIGASRAGKSKKSPARQPPLSRYSLLLSPLLPLFLLPSACLPSPPILSPAGSNTLLASNLKQVVPTLGDKSRLSPTNTPIYWV